MPTRSRRQSQRLGAPALRAVTAAGLAVDAYLHADLAGQYGGTGLLGIQHIFLGAAGAAAVGALLIVAVRRRWAALPALLISAGTVAAVLAFRYVDLGPLGPLPDLYEPIWYPEKLVSAAAEAAAAIAAALLLRPAPGAAK
jgi:hypothetical protein